MNEELTTRIESYLDTLEQSVGTAGEFVVEQTPLVVQEYLVWVFWSSVFSVVAGVASVAAAALIGVCVANHLRKFDDFIDANPVFVIPGAMTAAFLLLFGLATVATDSGKALKVSIAPRVVILEKVAELMP